MPPPNITIMATGMYTPTDIGTAIARDENGIMAVVTNAPEKFPTGTSKVTWIAFDNSKNTAEAYQYVTVLACGLEHSEYNIITGTDNDEVIDGTHEADLIFGQGGRDLIDGKGGDDCIFGEGDDDFIVGGTGNDEIYGGTGNDILRGQADMDVILGGTGADVLDGGDEMDHCHGDDLDFLVSCEAVSQIVLGH